jgi:hypothetical protein
MIPPAPTADAIAASMRLFLSPGQVTELRALNVGGENRTFAGFFEYDRLRDFSRHALALSREASGVYFQPNPVNPSLLARKPNTVSNVPGRKSPGRFELTTDRDVLERRYLFVDVDPARFRPADQSESGAVKIDARRIRRPLEPAEQKQPSTTEELLLAQFVGERVKIELTHRGMAKPLVMQSGNGVHLLFPLSVPMDYYPPELDPLSEMLCALARELDFAGLVTIDRNTYTASRMLKVPGTMSRKGTASPGRPYRRVEIIEVPNGWNAEAGPHFTSAGDRGVPL